MLVRRESARDFEEIASKAKSLNLELELELRLEGVFDTKLVCPLSQKRWIGNFISAKVSISSSAVDGARRPNCGLCRSYGGPSVAEANAIHVHMTEAERLALVPDPEALRLLSKAKLLPTVQQDRMRMSENEVLQSRIRSFHMPLCGLMAASSHGRIFSPPIDVLREKGLSDFLSLP